MKPSTSHFLVRNLLALSLISSVLILVTGCGGEKIPYVPSRQEDADSMVKTVTLNEKQESNLKLELSAVKKQVIDVAVDSTGQIQALNTLIAHSYSPVRGQAIDVLVQSGQVVKQGQLLARLKSDEIGELQTNFLQEEMNIEADLKQAKVDMTLSQANYKREKQLFDEQISPRADLESAQASYQKSLSAVHSLESKKGSLMTAYQARFTLNGVSPSVAQQILNNRTISPIVTIHASKGGVVIQRNVNPGELVDNTKELFTIADLDHVALVGNLYENDIHKVKLGQSVEVKVDSLPETSFSGKLNFVGAILDPSTRTLEVRAEVINTPHQLKPNMFARLRIFVGEKQATVVPNNALQRYGDYVYAYVPVSPHVYEERQVKIGIESNGYTEILNGLNPGDSVVSNGTLGLKGEFLQQALEGKTEKK